MIVGWVAKKNLIDTKKYLQNKNMPYFKRWVAQQRLSWNITNRSGFLLRNTILNDLSIRSNSKARYSSCRVLRPDACLLQS